MGINASILNNVSQDSAPCILIADDDISVLYALEWVLKDISCNIFSTMNVEDTIRTAMKEHPDLAILDMRMPKNVKSAGLFSPYAGTDICKELRSHSLTKDIPIIILTVVSESEGMSESLNAGADEYLTKPFNPETLLKTVKKFIKS
ncbi:MAG: hypothetical protein QG641_2092 [Candidatus Poribacteria bacterium]|nr:hypothetical protein [Candidatus Poribacteria bacterium]